MGGGTWDDAGAARLRHDDIPGFSLGLTASEASGSAAHRTSMSYNCMADIIACMAATAAVVVSFSVVLMPFKSTEQCNK
jgi:hypothetical protein